MSICEVNITDPKKQLEFYKDLSEQRAKENQELKKQLENCFCNRTDCAARIRDSKKYDSLEQKIENQQKEFIGYLENELTDGRSEGNTWLMGCYDEAKEILDKYKEIIGVKDNDSNM